MMLSYVLFFSFLASIGLPILLIGILGKAGKFDKPITDYLNKRIKLNSIQVNTESVNQEINEYLNWIKKIWLFLIGFSILWLLLGLIIFNSNYL